MTVQLLGAPVAEKIHKLSTEAVAAGLRSGFSRPLLLSLHLGEATPFRLYAARQAKAAERVGIGFRSEALPEGATASTLRERLRAADNDPAVTGVLLEHPLPKALDFFSAVSMLRAEKDIDGVGAANLGGLVARRPVHVPAVALASREILRHYRIETAGRRVSILGRSSTVGLPTAILFLARGDGGDATVTVAHSLTSDLAASLRGSDVIISCTGRPGFLDRRRVPEGAAVVDVGLSAVADPARPGGLRAAGDADPKALDGWASALTPVPGGVGPVTVACLMSNVVRAWELQREGKRP
ncbi:MAG: bifunctional 5,10-methylenetetrahydrofolate dehydrogenase/5,10-methenyltetrahydrofolate cyclohydrolase [Thermoplasmata archaeon]|nr:bifunctional 5,10-methylenetetrahydrofolate dehydrogenase/5,10-methenyltetrahydrofolate cyclohydrolase [Thermoplasmata archaeon]